MAPSKEERGGAPTRRTLFSQSQQVGGGWLNTTCYIEIQFVPQEGRPLQSMDSSNARGRDSRQASLFGEPYPEIQDTQEAPQAPEEEGTWLEGLADDRGLSGSHKTHSTAWTPRQRMVKPSCTPETRSAQSTLVTPSPSLPPSSGTQVPTLSHQRTHSPTLPPPDIASGESSESSGASAPRPQSKRLPPSSPRQRSASSAPTPAPERRKTPHRSRTPRTTS